MPCRCGWFDESRDMVLISIDGRAWDIIRVWLVVEGIIEGLVYLFFILGMLCLIRVIFICCSLDKIIVVFASQLNFFF